MIEEIRSSLEGLCHDLTMTLQSSEPLAMTRSLWGDQSMSNTGPVWPHTVGYVLSIRPVWNTTHLA